MNKPTENNRPFEPIGPAVNLGKQDDFKKAVVSQAKTGTIIVLTEKEVTKGLVDLIVTKSPSTFQ